MNLGAGGDELTGGQLVAVAERMRAGGVPPAGPLEAELIAGGRSNLTYRLTDGSRRWVLRTPPRHGRTPSAHDVVREYRVTAALGPTDVPVPPAVLLCEDDEPIGGPFVISDYVDGAVVKTRPQLAALDGATVSGVLDALITTLVALHRVDHRAAGLERFGRPDGYAARLLRRWSGQWAIVGAPPLAGLADEVIGRLAAAVPEQRHTSVVHGDYRIDNTIVRLAPVPVVAAVVDWELSTIGDPVADVAMMCAYRAPAFDLIVGEPGAWTSPDLPDSDGLAARYEAAGGCALADWDVHLALAYFKIAVIAAGIDHRRREGSGSGAGFDTSGEAVGPFLELARHSVAAVR